MVTEYRKSSHTTFRIELHKRYWGQHLWARGYFAVSVGNVSKDMVAEYITHHFENKEDGSDPFRVEKA